MYVVRRVWNGNAATVDNLRLAGVSHSKLKKLSGRLNLHLFTMLNPCQRDQDLAPEALR